MTSRSGTRGETRVVALKSSDILRAQVMPLRNLASLLTLALLCMAAANLGMAQEHVPITITRLYTGTDGMSHVEQIEVKFSPVSGAPNTVAQSEPVSPAKSYLVRLPPGFFADWHNADVRRYVVTLSGRAEVEVTGGQKFVAHPGEIVLAEDLSGKGHTFRVLGNADWVAFFVDMNK